jgi:hypothetical protein
VNARPVHTHRTDVGTDISAGHVRERELERAWRGIHFEMRMPPFAPALCGQAGSELRRREHVPTGTDK